MRILKNNKSGFVLLASLFIALFLTIFLGVAFMRSGAQLDMANLRRATHESFHAAESGIERAVFELRSDGSWQVGEETPFTDTIASQEEPDDAIGSYAVEVAAADDLFGFATVWVRSLGLDSLGDVPRAILARVLIENPGRFMVSTLGELRIASGATVDEDILAKDIIFDVNASLPDEEQTIIINGDIFYINSITGETNPAVVINGEAPQETPSITFAGVDLVRYETIAQSLVDTEESFVHDGNLTIDLADLDGLITDPVEGGFEPQIIYVNGDVTVSGEYNVSLLIVADGNVIIDGAVIPDSSVEDVPQIGLFAKQDVIIPEGVAASADGDLAINAFVMADGDGESEGLFIAEGPVGSLGTLEFTGAIAVRGKGATAVDMDTFDDRLYTYNTELISNRKIPFVPFIANIIEWREVNPNDPFPPT